MTRPLITTVRCEVLGNHCHVQVWNRGGKAGTLVVGADDGVKLALRLIPHGCENLDATGTYRRWALAQAHALRDGYTLTATQDDEDLDRVHIAIDGAEVAAANWDGDGFDDFDIRPTPIEAENVAARDELTEAYAAALKRLEDQ